MWAGTPLYANLHMLSCVAATQQYVECLHSFIALVVITLIYLHCTLYALMTLQAAYELLAEGRTLAAHMTCYGHSTKVLSLKATNAFWNPLYYDPLRPTLTKQIVFISEQQASCHHFYCVSTIFPPVVYMYYSKISLCCATPKQINLHSCCHQVLDEVRSLVWLGQSTRRAVTILKLLGPDYMPSGGYFAGRKFWPGFRVAKIKREDGVSVLKVDILEPGT